MSNRNITLMDVLGLHPFDPKSDIPRDVGFGGVSTEYTRTMPMGGAGANVPSIWWDKTGNPYVLPDDDAPRAMAEEVQQKTG